MSFPKINKPCQFAGNRICWSEYFNVACWTAVSLDSVSYCLNMFCCHLFDYFSVGCSHGIRAMGLSSETISYPFYQSYSEWFGSCHYSFWAKLSTVYGFKWVQKNDVSVTTFMSNWQWIFIFYSLSFDRI